jgi:hypothetical protein
MSNKFVCTLDAGHEGFHQMANPEEKSAGTCGHISDVQNLTPYDVEFVPDQKILDQLAQEDAHIDAQVPADEVRILLTPEGEKAADYIAAHPNEWVSRWYLIEAVSVDTCKHLLKSGYDLNNPKHAEAFELRRKDLGFSFKPPMAGAKQWKSGEGAVGWTDDVVKKYPNDPVVLLHLANIKRAQEILVEEADIDKESALDQATQETTRQFPECPIFPGTLTDLARAIYPSLPLEFKMWGLITRWGLYRSGLDCLANEPHIQPRFYTALVSTPNRGKTACINESQRSMELITSMAKAQCAEATKPHGADVECLASADSGPFLVEYLYKKARQAKDDFVSSITFDDRAKVILDSDELSDIFEKGRSSAGRASTFFEELKKLHSGNRTANGTRRTGDLSVDKAHLALLSGTTVKKYPQLWVGTGGGGDGLISRFIIITTNAPQVPPVPLLTDTVAAMQAYERLVKLAQLPSQTITLSDEAAKVLTEWWNSFDTSKESASRILETVKQLLIVLAITNAPEGHVGNSLMADANLVREAIKFGDYEIAIREILNPGDAWSNVQAMEDAIIKWAQKNAKKEAKSIRDFRRGIHPQRMPGGLGTFLLAWKNCVEPDLGVLKFCGKVGKSKLYRL